MALNFSDVMVTLRFTRIASEDLDPYLPVRLHDSDPEQVRAMIAINEPAIGITEFGAVAGQPVSLMAGGLLPVRSITTLAANELVWPLLDGVRPYIVVGAPEVYRNVIGRSLTPSHAAGELILVQWHPHSFWQSNAS